MSEIEKLTDEERRACEHFAGTAAQKLLRIHDAQAKRTAELEGERNHWMIAEDRAQQRTNALSLVLERVATVMPDMVAVRAALEQAGYPVRWQSETALVDTEGRAKELEARLATSRRRITDLEAQVLASETVSKVEYAAMVAQRDTMREELKAARYRIAELEDEVAELEGERNDAVARCDALRVLVAESAEQGVTGEARPQLTLVAGNAPRATLTIEGIEEAIWVAEVEGQQRIVAAARSDLEALLARISQIEANALRLRELEPDPKGSG